MNIISFDTEEWYIEKAYYGNRPERYPVFDGYLNRILDMLDEHDIKATFFCVGGLAKEFPHVLRKIADRGHEIGCHSYSHVWLSTLDQEGLYADTRTSIDALEDIIGKKVLSYRAPAFSIGEGNKWALEVLADCGIERDASIYPSTRDFGGFSSFPAKEPCIIKIGNKPIKEFPICLTKVMNIEFAFSGGGYFRLFPLWFVKKQMHNSNYAMCYFHIDDLEYQKFKLQDRASFEEYYKIPGTLKNRALRSFKHSIGTKSTFNKMTQLVSSFPFINLEQADQMMEWSKAQVVEL